MFHDHQDAIPGPHFDAGLFFAGRLTRLHKGESQKKAGWQKLGGMMVEANRRKSAGETGGRIDMNSVQSAPAPASRPAPAPAPDNSAGAPPQKKRKPYRGTLFTGGSYQESNSGGGSTLLG